jgi:hypothetical protein
MNPPGVPICVLDVEPRTLLLFKLEADAAFRLKEDLGIRSRTFSNIDKTTLDDDGRNVLQQGMVNPTHISFIVSDLAPVTGCLDNINREIPPDGPKNLVVLSRP